MRIALIALIIVASFMASVSQAVATRPIIGFDYPDVCKNIKGTQTTLDMHAPYARYRFIIRTPRPYDCRITNGLRKV